MHSFDLRKTLIPFSVLQVTNHFSDMEVLEEMEIIGDNIEIYRDIKSILPASDYELIFEEFKELPTGEFRIILRKINTTSPNRKSE